MQVWVGGDTNACYARSNLIDLNDFLIHSNALYIGLSCNLITQSHGVRFCEYINKWQLFLLYFMLTKNRVYNLHVSI